ncbi:MAG TPA: hypothetical protein VFN65_15820, partial [Solirubrobacteraceae bacterium]|nr:hypothetical protein [Solirubrobacteraceae bacterium]
MLGLGLGFITSYVGAFHRPTPHGVVLTVAGPGAAANHAITHINAVPGHPLSARAAADPAAARTQVVRDRAAAALLIDPRSSRDRLLVASGGGAALTSAVEAAVARIERAGHR